jgi:hypothetical protein
MVGTSSFRKTLLIAAAWLSIGWGSVRAQESPAGQPQQHPLIPAIEIARGALAKVDALADYEGTLTKRELINGALTTQMMQIRVREKPFAVYLKYAAPNEGREVLYDAAQDPAQLLAHEGSGLKSLAGTLALPINDPQVMAETRHPVTDLGLRRLIQLVIQQWEFESKYGEIDVQYFPDAKFGKISCEALKVTHPKPRRQFKYHQTLLFIEKSSGLPLRVMNYGFPQQAGNELPLIEDYAYTGLKTNVGLKTLDFSRTNPNYRFQ